MRVFITGHTGFIGSSLIERLEELRIEIYKVGVDDFRWVDSLRDEDIVFYLKGVSRSDDYTDFYNINFVKLVLFKERLSNLKVHVKIVFPSSIHSGLESIYGISKKFGEYIFSEMKEMDVNIAILPGVFGVKSPPNRYSVVSTFVYNMQNNLESVIHDASAPLKLLSISNLLDYFIEVYERKFERGIEIKTFEENLHHITVGELHKLITGNEDMAKQFQALWSEITYEYNLD